MSRIYYVIFLGCVLNVLLHKTEANRDNSVVPDTLKMAQILCLEFIQLMRHGDRLPDKSFKSAEGGLTQEGKKQTHDLGLYHRQRYQAFLSSTYYSEETTFVSSDTGRTIDSMYLFTRALYEDSNGAKIWNKGNLMYDPVPVRSIPAQFDKYLQMTKPCPRLENQGAERIGQEVAELISKKRKSFETYVAQTGDDTLFNDALGASRIENFALFLEDFQYNISQHLPVEEWVTTIFEDPELLAIKVSYCTWNAFSTEQQMLYSGPFLQLILDNFENPTQKFTFFMGHDRNIFTIMHTLGVWDPKEPFLPPTGSSLIFELHQREVGPGGDYVELWYRNSTDVPPRLLEIPKCKNPCLLTEFRRHFEDVLPVNYDKQCEDV